MVVKVLNGKLSQTEVNYYTKYAADKWKCAYQIDIKIDGDYVDIFAHIQPFERIRRITGYLVGTLDRWNDAKRAEEHDRVKHSFDITDYDRFND